MTEGTFDRRFAIELPVRHWVAMLALLDQVGVPRSVQAIMQLREEGKTEDDLDLAEITALMSPILVRAAIVDKLAELGEISPEAREQAGTPLLRRWRSRLDAHTRAP